MLEELITRAEQKRSAMNFPVDGAYRLFDGGGDGLPGLVIEVYAGWWLVQTAHLGLPEGLLPALQRRGVGAYWKQLSKTEKQSPEHLCGPWLDGPFHISEMDCRFKIDFNSGYSQGVFIDQRDNRREVAERMRPGLRLLNTFSYTCAFSVAAALAGATTTSVDLSANFLGWGRENFLLNGLDPDAHYFTRGDTREWLAVFARKGVEFDGIILDPPTFSRPVRGRKTWKVEKDFSELVAAACRVLVPGGWILCSTNCRRLGKREFAEMIRVGGRVAGRRLRWNERPMPADFTDEPYLLSGFAEG